MTPLSPHAAAVLVGWEGAPHNLRRRMIRYLDRREKALGIRLWTKDQDGRRTVTEAALRVHCQELFQKSLKEVKVEIGLRIERLEARLNEVVDERMAGPLRQAQRDHEELARSLAKLVDVTETRFCLLERRVNQLESTPSPTITDQSRQIDLPSK